MVTSKNIKNNQGYKVYLINMDKDALRLQHMEAQFASQSIDFERISAINGRELPQSLLATFTPEKTSKPTPWAPAHIGCWLSHMAAWKKIAESGISFGIVMEDDMHLSPSLSKILANSTWTPNDFDIIRLEVSTNALWMDKHPAGQVESRGIYRVKSTSWCAGAYVISANAAQRLLDMLERDHSLANAADAFLFEYETSSVARNLKTYQMDPAPAMQDKYMGQGASGFGSNIEDLEQNETRSLYLKLPKITPSRVKKWIRGYRKIKFN